MHRIPVIIFLMVACGEASGQIDSITTRDTVRFSYEIRKNLIQEYNNTLNFISDIGAGPNEIEKLIHNKVKGGREQRIFTDENVRIDYDLTPGADTTMAIQIDKSAEDYLRAFSTNYKKQEDNTVTLTVLYISPLKKVSYFFYNVLFECRYDGTNYLGEKFPVSKRLAEVKLFNDSGWHYYINAIHMVKDSGWKPGRDTSSIYKGIVKMEVDVEMLLRTYDAEGRERLKKLENEMKGLVEEGDDFYEMEKFEDALSKYREARKINLAFLEPIEKIKKTKEAIVRKIKEEQAKKERMMHMVEMRINAFKFRDNYDFKAAKVICDSLILNYEDKDSGIARLRSEISKMLSSLSGIESAMNINSYDKAIKYCKEGITATTDKIYKAEFCYRLALVYYSFDYSENKIMDNLNQAIELSNKQHQMALKLRAEMYRSRLNEPGRAIIDASQMINNDSRNPHYYIYRAGIYEGIKNLPDAINDYGEAISFGTSDSTAYLKKTILEFNLERYMDAKSTASVILNRNRCYADVLYYRGRANEKLSDYVAAGNDFFKALSCGVDSDKVRMIKGISASHFTAGKVSFAKREFRKAQDEFTSSILLDSNNNSFFHRALIWMERGLLDSADADLSTLIRRNNKFPQAYYRRGLVRLGKNMFEASVSDFTAEITNGLQPKEEYIKESYVKRADAEVKLLNDPEAAKDYEKAGKDFGDDVALQFAAEAYFRIKNLNKVVDVTTFSEDELKTQRPRNFYWRGRAFYDSMEFKKAKKDFDKTLEFNQRDADAAFWRGRIFMEDEKYESAVQDFRMADSSAEFKGEAYFNLGYSLLMLRNDNYFANASDNFIKSIETDSSRFRNAETFSWIAYAKIRKDRTATNDNLEKAKTINAENPVYNFAAACYYSQNNTTLKSAFEFLEKALQSARFSKSYITSEPYLYSLKESQETKAQYKSLIKKYFP